MSNNQSECTIEVLGHHIAYTKQGSGYPVVLLHGLGAGKYIWDLTVPTLSSSFTVYAVDMLGCNGSDKPHIDYSFEMQVAYVYTFLKNVGIEQCYFVGHSFGGAVAIKLLNMYPHLIHRLVLVDCLGFGKEINPFLRLGTLPLVKQLFSLVSDNHPHLQPLALRIQAFIMNNWHIVDKPWLPTLLERLKTPEEQFAFFQMIQSALDIHGQKLNVYPLLTPLPPISFLIAWGANDPIVPVKQAYRAAEFLTGAALKVFPGCAHDPQIEEAQLFNELLLKFFTQG